MAKNMTPEWWEAYTHKSKCRCPKCLDFSVASMLFVDPLAPYDAPWQGFSYEELRARAIELGVEIMLWEDFE